MTFIRVYAIAAESMKLPSRHTRTFLVWIPSAPFGSGLQLGSTGTFVGSPLRLTAENIESIPADHAATSVAQNLEKLLQYLVRHSGRPGALVPIEQSQDYTIIDVQGESEMQYYLRCLAEMDLIKAYIPNPKYELTYRGWDRALGASAGAAAHGRVFVAMWFDPEMGAAYKEGIEPALVETGYKPICLSNVLLNDDINFRILMEIRLAQFTVADITGARGGVYFESRFRKGPRQGSFFYVSRRPIFGR